MIGEALGPEAAPVVGHDLVERVDYIVERVRFQHGTRAGRAVEELAKIIQRFLAFALLADGDVNPQPVQRVFFVEVDAATPGFPRMRSEIKLRGCIGSVLQVAPGASRSVVEGSGG